MRQKVNTEQKRTTVYQWQTSFPSVAATVLDAILAGLLKVGVELAALDCVKQVPQLQDIKQTLRAIHKHYTCSAKASRELQEISKAIEISIVRPGNTEGTRWLPHMSYALEALMRNYRPILVHFENHASDPNDREANAAMRGRAKLVQHTLKQYNMLLFIHLMLDVLQELKHLRLLFQQEGLTLQMVSD
ncbi:unnamed protein product [Leuciscus chuanchicus]